MVSEPRAYRGYDDLQAMRALLQAGRQAGNGAYYVHPGDLNWWLFYPPIDHDHFQHLYLVDDPERAGHILAWILLSPDGFNTFDVFVQPGLRGSASEAAWRQWAEARLTSAVRARGEHKIRSMWVRSDDRLATGWLEAHGFQQASTDVHLVYNLDAPPVIPTTARDFQVRSSAGVAEVRARAAAQYGAFGSQAPFERYVERFQRFMQSPVYAPEWDIVAAVDGDRIGAFCIAWPDPLSRVGLFEPVGTHPDFQRQGMGKAVMLEALRRLHQAGMRQAIVTTSVENTPAVRLYESVGFQIAHQLLIFEKAVVG